MFCVGKAAPPLPSILRETNSRFVDHGKVLPELEGVRREGMTQVVDVKVIEAGAASQAAPRLLHVRQVLPFDRAYDHIGVVRPPGDRFQDIDCGLTDWDQLAPVGGGKRWFGFG